MRDCFAATNDGVVLATVLNTVEQISEVAGRIGRSDVRHPIRLSDTHAKVNLRHADHPDENEHIPEERRPARRARVVHCGW